MAVASQIKINAIVGLFLAFNRDECLRLIPNGLTRSPNTFLYGHYINDSHSRALSGAEGLFPNNFQIRY